jgi:tRNA 2-thiouridine synthesizing protein E
MHAQHALGSSARAPHEPAPSFDEAGFLRDPLLWTEDLAREIAKLYGIGPLSDRHWRVIDHIRERYFRVGGLPALRLVCRATSLTREDIYALFGGCCAAWRIAGLPDPGEEARAYFN